jgi:hypothetical protein
MEQIHHFFLHPFSIFPLSDVVEADVGRLNWGPCHELVYWHSSPLCVYWHSLHVFECQ